MVTERKNHKFHVVFLGESGFPYGLASMNKMILVSKALINADVKVTVINRKGKLNPDENTTLDKEGVFQDIHYIYTSGDVYRPQGFLKRNLTKIKGKYGEFRYLQKLKRNNDLDAGIIFSLSFFHTLSYRIFSLLSRFPVVLSYVEYGPYMQHRKGILTKINDILFDPILVKCMDGALPISEFLVSRFERISPNKPLLKIPVLCDFAQFEVAKNEVSQSPYFLFCGALDYREVLDFIIQSFTLLPSEYKANLYLVVGETKPGQFKKFKKDIRDMENVSRIKIFTKLDYSDLVFLYLNAKALLIPLRPTRQDAARFPHKIGEYVASGNPIVTTNVGEIIHYFKNGENALIADEYEVSSYVKKMIFVLDNPNKAKEIGQKGKELGLNNFNYLNYGQKLKSFLLSINK